MPDNILSAETSVADLVQEVGARARAASKRLAACSGAQRAEGLRAAAEAIRADADLILAANAIDVANAHALPAPMRDRLALTPARLEAMAAGVSEIAAQEDPIGAVDQSWTRPNGLAFQRVRVPLGVIGIIYESRPNVTADAGALCVKSGNAAVLRGGSDSFHSSQAILAAFKRGLASAGLPEDAVQSLPTADRAAVGAMLTLSDSIDVIVPRGGKGLIERVQRESRIPVIAHLDGVCHVYVDRSADPEKAKAILLNAKLRRTSVCGSAETLLIDRQAPLALRRDLVLALLDAGCAVRGDADLQAIDPRVSPVAEADWGAEYLDAIIAAGLVDDVDAAIAHVERYGSHHTDAIVAEDPIAAEKFLAGVDSAIVLLNASTQYADGGEFGFGGEIGIATGKLHARGPVGAAHLTSWKYVVRGSGQVRP
ncbi:MAG: glutamate-5-semialdehyde dehydrogenase [Elsteraceae bacterium]